MPEREPVTRERLERFLRELGRRYRGGGRLYLVGGALMVYADLLGQSETLAYTVQLEGDHQQFITAVRSLIREMNISVESAGPADFIPLPVGWRDRSRFIGRYGRLDVFTLDVVSTALAKVERGDSRDIEDVLVLLRSGALDLTELTDAFEQILPRLEKESVRVDEADFRRKFDALVRLAPGRE